MNIHKNKNTVIEEVNGKNIIINLDNGGFFQINEIGLEIWNAIYENMDKNELIEIFNQKYKNENVEKDCLDFLKKLDERKLISFSD